MARWWVGGSGTWDASTTTNWAASSGGAGGASVPTSTDDVVFDAASNTTGYTVTVTGTATCRDLSFSAAPSVSGTITLAGSGALDVYGSMSLLTGMTWSYFGLRTHRATSGTKTITSNGVNLNGSTVFNGSGGTFQLADNFSTQGSALTLTAGTFDANGKTVTLTRSASTVTITGAFTFFNLTFNSGSAGNDLLTLASGITVTGTLTLTGNSAIKRLFIFSDTAGTARTITAAAVSLTNTDFTDITGAGAATWSGTSLGDALGNSGITFTVAATQYWKTSTTGTKTWSTAANWFLATNGGGGAGRVPLPQDDVVFDASSIGAASTTISADMPRLGKSLTFTGITNAPTLTFAVSGVLYGSLALGSGMLSGYGNNLTFSARSNVTIRSAGVALQVRYINSVAAGFGLTMQDALDASVGLFEFTQGTGNLDTGGFNLTVYNFNASSAGARTLTFGTSTITVTGSGASAFAIHTSITLAAGTSTIKFTDATSTAKLFAGGGKTYNNIWLSGAGSGAFQFTGSNTFNDFRVDTLPKNIQFTAGTTTTIASWTGPAYSAAATKFARLNATSGNYFSTPNAVGSTLTGDLSCVVSLSLNSLTPAAAQLLMSQLGGVSSNWELYLNTTGELRFVYSTNGSALLTKVCTATLASVGLAAGQLIYVAVYHDVDNGASGNAVKFYYSTDGSAWTQLGSTVTTAGAVTRFSSTLALEVGSEQTGLNVIAGDIYRARLYSGDFQSGGSVVADFNPNTWNSGNTWTSATTAEVWTRNGSALLSPEVKISSITSATHTLTKTGGGVVDAGRRGNITYSIGSPASTFYAGANGTNGGNNTNWTFNNAPATASYSNTEGSETLSGAGANACAASWSVTEASETVVSAGTNTGSAAAAITEGSDTLAAAGQLSIGAAFVETDSEALLAAGTNAITGGATITEDDDTLGGEGYRWIPSRLRRYTVVPNRGVET